MDRFASLTELKGAGDKTCRLFEKIDVYTIDDLLTYYPRTYYKYEEEVPVAQVKEDETNAVRAVITKQPASRFIRNLSMVTAELADASGTIQARWFHMPYLKSTLKQGAEYVFVGRVNKKGSRRYLDQPALYTPQQYEELRFRLQPVYALTKGITNHTITKLVRQACENLDLSRDYMPDSIRKMYRLSQYDYALEEIHFPQDEHHCLLARKRLVFDEFFFFLLTLRSFKSRREETVNQCPMGRMPVCERVIQSLGYELTGAQKKVWEEIQKDLTGDRTMVRLIQGDVGSGKTILALLAMIMSAGNGYQSAMMVPTEVLARQHFEACSRLLEQCQLPFKALLLTGSMTAKEKKNAYRMITDHEADLVIGTHAVIQEKVVFDRLGLVITDEQHRFGVRQREILEEKGLTPHTMVMSATPIPRTLAVILYGDLEISVIDEMPASRIPIKNCVVDISYRRKAYDFITKQVREGRQAYVICPMVEESELMEAEDVLSYTKKLKNELPDDIVISALHGKMKPREKNDIMERFLRNEIQVLVSTTVVEVGVNVPNATVMMIENAERFGLAQLHQLRGRVGRGKDQSYCIMISAGDSQKNKKRLEILNHSNDGFYIANEDLKLRGPGDLLGVRQSGLMEFKIGDIYTDAAILAQASEAAGMLLNEDPELLLPEHRELKKRLDSYLENEMRKLNL